VWDASRCVIPLAIGFVDNEVGVEGRESVRQQDSKLDRRGAKQVDSLWRVAARNSANLISDLPRGKHDIFWRHLVSRIVARDLKPSKWRLRPVDSGTSCHIENRMAEQVYLNGNITRRGL